MKKRIICVGLLCMTLCMSACTFGRGSGDNSSSTQQSTTGQTESGMGGTEDNGLGNGNGMGTDDGINNGTGTGSGIGSGTGSLSGIRSAVEDALGENYWPNMSLESDMLAETYGVTEDMYDEFFAETPMISTNVDTLIVVKAKEGQVSAVEDALNAYRDKNVGSTTQYPANLGKIQASRIETIGNYVCFVQLGADTTDAADQNDEAVIAQCQEENEKAIDAIRNILQNQ